VPLMPTLLHDFRSNPTSTLLTVRCFPWSVGGKACLFGDAAHAVVPFFGQGMNCAFEDCAVFDEVLEELGGRNFDGDWSIIFHRYENLRKENTDAIADMALENFIEMRDKVADPQFLFMQKVNRLLGLEFPGNFLSRYEMVSFTRLAYKQAKDRGAINDSIVRELMEGVSDIERIDLKRAKELVETRLPPVKFQSS